MSADTASTSAAAQQGELVQLYVYDLSGGMARTFSQMLLGRQIEAIYHTSIVVGAVEHYFGAGISTARPGGTPFGRPMQVLNLGYTQLAEDMRAELLASLSERFTPQAYNLWNNNCNTFSDEFASLLCGVGVPSHITGLPSEVLSTPFGQMIQPMLSGLEQQLRSMPRQQALATAAAAVRTPPAAAVGTVTEAGGEAVAQAPSAAPPAAAEGAPGEALPAPSGISAAVPAAEEAEAPALHAAEVEIEAAVAAGMIQEAGERLQELHMQAGSPPASVAAAEVASGASSADVARLDAELAVERAYKGLLEAGLPAHEAAAMALEAVAAARESQQGDAQVEGAGA